MEETRYLPPAKGRSQYAHMLQALYSVKPELCYVNYREAFQYLVARHPKRALTMVFTDLLDATASKEYLEAAALLRRFHLPLTRLACAHRLIQYHPQGRLFGFRQRRIQKLDGFLVGSLVHQGLRPGEHAPLEVFGCAFAFLVAGELQQCLYLSVGHALRFASFENVHRVLVLSLFQDFASTLDDAARQAR